MTPESGPGPGSDPADPAEPEPADSALLAAHRDGDRDAFGTLFGRHRDRLWAVALRTTGNPEDAADALQDAMISAFTRAETFRGEAAVSTWLHRIVVNAALDRLRRNRVRRVEPLPDDLDERAARGAVLAAALPGDDPQSRAETSDRRRVLVGALDRIPLEQKVALVLVDLEGYPVAEAARILDCPVGTVKSRCARGRARLADELRGTGLLDDASDPAEATAPTTTSRPTPGGAPS